MSLPTASGQSAPVDAPPRKVVPVRWWATLGALVLAFIAYVLIDWVTGPYFERVPVGPSEVPTYMKVAVRGFEAVSIPVALVLVWVYVLKPLRQSRRLPLDGMLVIAFCTLWFQDPLSAYGGHWFVYNSYAVNWGSWVHSVPGWLSYGEPGSMLVEPVLIIPALYVYVFVIVMLWGCFVMRRIQARWPRMGKVGLIGGCFVAMVAFDIVLEAIIFMPLGIWEYPGGHFSIFPDRYHAFPLNEIITVSATFTAVASLRFFRDDKGRSVVERGSDELTGPTGRRYLLRTLAVVGAVHAALFATYTLPNTWIGLHGTEWQADLVERSYFTDGLCGEGTDRACPGPGVPHVRNDNSGEGNGSAYVTRDGGLGLEEDTDFPENHPFKDVE